MFFQKVKIAKEKAGSNSTSQAFKIIPASQIKKNFWNLTRETWNNSIYPPRWVHGQAWGKLCNRYFIIFNKKSFGKKKFWNRCTGKKVPKWLFGKKIATLPFWHFFPCASISKIFFAKWLLVDYYERPINQFFSKSVSGAVQARPCTHLGG